MRKLLIITIAFIASKTLGQTTFTALNTNSNTHLLGISFANSTLGYACGDAGTILKTVDGGVTWTSLNTGVYVSLWDIKVMPGSSGTKVIAVGDSNKVIKSTNGGLTWITQSIPFEVGSFVFGVQCLDTLNYFACGGDFETFSGAVLKTTDGGLNWSKTAVYSSIFLDKINMLNSTEGLVVGTNNSFSDGSIHNTTNASSWSLAKTSNSIITNGWCLNQKKRVCVGLNGQIWRSTNGGSSWISTSFNTEDLYGIQFLDTLKGFACGGNGGTSIILSTIDGGTSWSQISHPLIDRLTAVSMFSNTIYMCGDNGTIIKGITTTTTSTVGVHQELAGEILNCTVFSNMENNDVIVLCPGFKTTERLLLTIMDASGRTIRKIELAGVETTLSFANYTTGIYCYTLNGGNSLSRGKFSFTLK